MRRCLELAYLDFFDAFYAHVQNSDALADCHQEAQKAVNNAVACLANLPDNEVRFAMRELAEQSIARLN